MCQKTGSLTLSVVQAGPGGPECLLGGGRRGAVSSTPLGPWNGGQYLSSSVGWATASFRQAVLASDTRLSDAREWLVSARRVMKRCASTSSWEGVSGQRRGLPSLDVSAAHLQILLPA